jgi:uncharacterized protein (TIGR03437 family)
VAVDSQGNVYASDSRNGIVVSRRKCCAGFAGDYGHSAGTGERCAGCGPIYCNALGAVSPVLATGSPAPADGPVSQTVNPVTMTIGGISEAALFAGLAPGFPDLYQVNAVVPAGVHLGNSVSVVLTVAGQSSPAVVTMAVQ